jgi:hypothetical protein
VIRAAIIAAGLALLSLPTWAQQQQPQPSAAEQLGGQFATMLLTTVNERDACRAQLAAQAAKAPTAPAQTPEAPKQP